MSPLSEGPRGVFELHVVPRCPSGVDGLLSDEAVTPAVYVLVDPVHLALINLLLIVVVRNSTVIGSTVGSGEAPEVIYFTFLNFIVQKCALKT